MTYRLTRVTESNDQGDILAEIYGHGVEVVTPATDEAHGYALVSDCSSTLQDYFDGDWQPLFWSQANPWARMGEHMLEVVQVDDLADFMESESSTLGQFIFWSSFNDGTVELEVISETALMADINLAPFTETTRRAFHTNRVISWVSDLEYERVYIHGLGCEGTTLAEHADSVRLTISDIASSGLWGVVEFGFAEDGELETFESCWCMDLASARECAKVGL